MKLEWVHEPRRPPWPGWAILLVAVWLVLGGTALLLGATTGRAVQLCMFKHLTGCPCPTCGFTRGTIALFQGHLLRAWLYNPLLFSFLTLLGGVVLIRLLWGARACIRLTRGERLFGWAILAVLFAANWLYVIRYVG